MGEGLVCSEERTGLACVPVQPLCSEFQGAGLEVQGLVAECAGTELLRIKREECQSHSDTVEKTSVLLVSVFCIVSCWRVFALTVELGHPGLTRT